MASGAYGKRLGDSVGVALPPTVKALPLRNAEFAATRIIWAENPQGVFAQIERENAFLVCLERRDVPSHPYWVDGRAVAMSQVRERQFSLLDLTYEHSSYNRDPIDCLAMYIPRSALDRLAEEHNAPRIDTIDLKPGLAVDDPFVWHLGECLLPAFDAPESANQLFVDHVAMALITRLAGAYGNFQPARRTLLRGGLAPWQERRAKELLIASIDGNIQLDTLARQCGLSRSHFARAFKVTTGAPPHRWLLGQRVERVKTLLLHSNMPIEEIAFRCGFADQSHLTRVFVRLVDATPGEWRRCHRS